MDAASNLALAVGADIDYSYCESEGQTLIVAEALREAVFRDIEHTVTKTVKGRDLVGLRYEQLFDYLEVDAPSAFQVLPADFVSTEDGTGIVHTAPAYGVDDLALGQEYDLPVIHGVGLDGNFIDAVEPVAGMFFKDADKVPLVFAYHEIIKAPPKSAIYDPARCDVIYDGSISPDFYGWVFPHGDCTSVGAGSAINWSQRPKRIITCSGVARKPSRYSG